MSCLKLETQSLNNSILTFGFVALSSKSSRFFSIVCLKLLEYNLLSFSELNSLRCSFRIRLLKSLIEDSETFKFSILKINFSKSGYFEVQVKHNDTRDAHYYYHTARVLGATNNKMNVIPMETGSMTIPIMGKNDNVQISIKTQAPTAMSLMGYTWEGNYIKRTKYGNDADSLFVCSKSDQCLYRQCKRRRFGRTALATI